MASESSGELIDWHSHCFLAEHRSKEALAERAAYGVRGSDDGTPERHRAAMEEAGVGKFVVVNVPRRKGHETPNEFIADYVANYPGRAIGLASVHPNDPDAAQDFEHSVRDLGIKGLKLSPVYQSFDPWTPEAYRLFEIAQDYQAPVMFHMGGMYDPHASSAVVQSPVTGQSGDGLPEFAHYRGPFWPTPHGRDGDVAEEE